MVGAPTTHLICRGVSLIGLPPLTGCGGADHGRVHPGTDRGRVRAAAANAAAAEVHRSPLAKDPARIILLVAVLMSSSTDEQ